MIDKQEQISYCNAVTVIPLSSHPELLIQFVFEVGTIYINNRWNLFFRIAYNERTTFIVDFPFDKDGSDSDPLPGLKMTEMIAIRFN